MGGNEYRACPLLGLTAHPVPHPRPNPTSLASTPLLQARTLGLDLAVDVLSGVKLEERGIQPAWLKSRMADFLGGLYGLPLALPGSPLAKALAAKEELLRVLVPAVEGRQQELLKLVGGGGWWVGAGGWGDGGWQEVK